MGCSNYEFEYSTCIDVLIDIRHTTSTIKELRESYYIKLIENPKRLSDTLIQ
jgi:hypothetical protein